MLLYCREHRYTPHCKAVNLVSKPLSQIGIQKGQISQAQVLNLNQYMIYSRTFGDDRSKCGRGRFNLRLDFLAQLRKPGGFCEEGANCEGQ